MWNVRLCLEEIDEVGSGQTTENEIKIEFNGDDTRQGLEQEASTSYGDETEKVSNIKIIKVQKKY